MAARLAGKVAIITGAARGIGAAAARLFIEEGAKVVLGDILDDEGQKLADTLNRSSARKVSTEEPKRSGSRLPALYMHLDVSQPESWTNAVGVAEREFGALNILVNNAGVTNLAGVEDTTVEEWDRVVAVNQKGVWLGMKTAIPAMRRIGGGSIVNISSVYAVMGTGDSTAYHGTKAAIRMLSKAVAVQYAREHIRVNTVLPGFTHTPMIDLLPPEVIQHVLAPYAPMNRLASPKEIAYGILFFASDESSYSTGAELIIDGGLLACTGRPSQT